MSRQADVSKATIESVERGLRVIAELNKRWEDRFSFDRPDLLKRYLDGRIHFYLKFRAWSSPQGNPVDFYTVLYSPRIFDCPGNRWGELDPKSRVGMVASVDMDGVAQNKVVGNDREDPVFVCDVEIVNYLQERIGRIRSPVWLQSFNKRPSRMSDSLYYSLLHGLFEFYAAPLHWEVDLFGVRQPVFASKGPDNVIEARSEMVNNFASDDGNAQGHRRPNEFENISTTFRLTLADNRVDATVQNGGNFTIEILDLLFGPLNLGPAPVEGM